MRMKKIKLMLSLLAMVCMFSLFNSHVKAANKINILLFGEEVHFVNKPMEVSGRILVPLRSVSEALGADVFWDERSQKITLVKGNVQNELYLNNSIANKYVADNHFDAPSPFTQSSTTLDVAPRAYDNVTYVPLRYIAESFGIEVAWNSNTSTVSLGLYTVPGTGKYSSWKLLKGHALESKYNLFVKEEVNGTNKSIQFAYEDLKPANLNETIKITYNGKSYKLTRQKMYEYFSDSLDFATVMEKLGDSKAINKQLDEHDAVFGKYFDEWFNRKADENNLPRYYDVFERQEQARQGKIANITPLDFDQIITEQARMEQEEKLYAEIEEQLEKLNDQVTNEWVRLLNQNTKRITKEWVDDVELDKKADGLFVASGDGPRTWRFQRVFTPIYEFSMTAEQYELAKTEPVDIDGIRIKRRDIMLTFNTSDLLKKNIIREEHVNILPELEEMMDQAYKLFLNTQYPQVDYIQFMEKFRARQKSAIPPQLWP